MKTKRKPLSKRTRFDVFKRDVFTCQYCGQNPPAVVLEIDHVVPVSKGGGNTKDNLLTACFDCNRGKSNTLLAERDMPIADRAAKAQEREDQIKAYRRLLKRIRSREDGDIDAVEQVLYDRFGWTFQNHFRESVRANFLPSLDVSHLVSFMHTACGRIDDPERAIKYFCGMCWRSIRGESSWPPR